MKPKPQWYAIRAVPGSQRMAKASTEKPSAGQDEELAKAKAARRVGESLLERDCRRKGFEVFMPGFWNTVQHQRTNKLIDRRFPLLVGYAFVCIGRESFEEVRKLDTVLGFIRNSYGPIPFDESVIGELAVAELQRKLDFDMARFQRESLNREHRRNVLNRHLGMIMPKGRRRKVPLRMLAEVEIDKLTGRSKERVEEILRSLDDLDKEEREACNRSEIAIHSAA